MDNHRNFEVPNIFISYSHDNERHKQWVLNLCDGLVSKGIQVIFDEWNPVGKNVQFFMESCTEYDKVVIVCTPNYVMKANNGKGGVGYEKSIITQEIIKDTNYDKCIPIVREKSPSLDVIPKFIGHLKYIDMSDDDKYETLLNKLSDTILGIDVEENQERRELAILERIHRKILYSKKDSIINSNDEKTIELLDKVLQELDNVRAYGHLEFSYLSIDMEESEIEELKFIIDELESMKLISVIRDKTINRYGDPIWINRIEAIFEKDISFINVIKEQLKPVLDDLHRGETIKADKILDCLNDIDKERTKNLILFALKVFESSRSIKLYIDEYLGFLPGDLENSTVLKL